MAVTGLEAFSSEANPDLSDAPALADLQRYWESKRHGKSVPLRADIDVLDLKAHLGTLFLAEPLPDGSDFRFRLIGTKLTQAAGQEFTNRTVSEIMSGLDPAITGSIIATYRKVLRDVVPIRSRGSLVWAGKDFIRFDSLHLPLSTDGQTPNMILGKQLVEALPAPDG